MSSMAWNPQLPPVHQGTWSDAQYLAEEADLRANIISQYQDVLDQLGYTSPSGEHIRGQVEIGYERGRQQLQDAIEASALGVTNASQREGTLFSGRRADRTALAEKPYRTSLTNLETDTPIALGKLGTRASQILGGYATRAAPLIAAAVGRWTPPAIGGGGGGGAGGGAAGGTFLTPEGTAAATPGTLSDAAGADQSAYFPGSPTSPVVNSGGTYVNPNDPDYRQRMAAGGIVDEPTDATIGEAGPEAVVPLEDGLPAAIQRLIAMDAARRRRQQQGFRWGGQIFEDPQAAVDWMNARGADTNLERFLMNHPGLAPGGNAPRNLGPPEQAPRGAAPRDMPNVPRPQGQGGQFAGKVRRANVHAAGLKAAAKIMSELAKHHEEDDGRIGLAPQPHPLRPPPRPMPPQRAAAPRFPGGGGSVHRQGLGTLV